MTERRRFSRIIYQVPALIEQGNLAMQATIQDLSLHGLLLKVEDAKPLDSLLPVEVGFSFIQSEQMMQLSAGIVSIAGNEIRLKISNIDIESISQLKRFIELNVGNNELLNRELEHLSDLGEK
ncbi:PilZ domain-containing protein [Vibrio campbellii]|uniref:Cyclic diguanosine monophosphate-binding protein n=1 Tax=Vibrio campbellii TaxID=680 RepID=A0AAQ2XWA4_9VIBR|nr:PilZ domain-containing protein [Vibrio campbellii]APX07230.1 PilZ domain-containing protein [Vibrio campbellii]MCE7727838.1 PilZ domain-containing protein [Vibrio campbellii]WDG07854.1 PilZ domain-containing protein [Vibrio campbellii]HDM8217330.1 PilZ domain-containing protein [Vibrio campbellii]HDM8232433.1 PilZ domain-containing protein [Vibrio campbellii]